jgi:hypothetical protein
MNRALKYPKTLFSCLTPYSILHDIAQLKNTETTQQNMEFWEFLEFRTLKTLLDLGQALII